MRWDRFELGPVLDEPPGGELRLAFDLAARASVCLRYYARAQSLAVGAEPSAPLAQPVGETPHLVRVLHIEYQSGEAWAEREVCIGPLLQALVDRGPASPAVVAGVLTQVLEGLRALHQVGGVHGTLSASSIVFDLTTGRVRLADLEAARVAGITAVPDDDLHAVGELCLTLLRGGRATTSSSPSQLSDSTTPLQQWARRCAKGSLDPFLNVEAALADLAGLGFERGAVASLPAGPRTRHQAMALAQLERWKAAAPTGTAEIHPLTYGQRRSSVRAERLWRRVGIAGLGLALISVGIVLMPGHGALGSEPTMSDDGCLPSAAPVLTVDGGTPGEKLTHLELQVRPGAAASLDGCALTFPEPNDGTLALWLAPGPHELRVVFGGEVFDQTVRVAGDTTLDLRAIQPSPESDGSEAADLAKLIGFVDAGRAVAREGAPAIVDDGGVSPADLLRWGMVEPNAQWLLTEDASALAPDIELRQRLPAPLALTLAGLRAADARFEPRAASCGARLRKVATPTLIAEQAQAAPAVVDAAVLLAATRVAAPQLAEPLRVEDRVLQRLGVRRNPRLNRTVDALLAQPELSDCLNALLPAVADVDEAAGRVLLLINPE